MKNNFAFFSLFIIASCNYSLDNKKEGDTNFVEQNPTLINNKGISSDSMISREKCYNGTIKGAGLVSFLFDDKSHFPFYKDKGDVKPLTEIQFFNDNSINSVNIVNIDSLRKTWFNPYVIDLDYSMLILQCVKVDDRWCKLIVNECNGECLWIKLNEKTTAFLSWADYILKASSINSINYIENPFRVKKTEKSSSLVIENVECLFVDSVDGDWLIMNWKKDGCESSKENPIDKVYLRWRSKNKLLVEILKD